jgi:hypothetical protein
MRSSGGPGVAYMRGLVYLSLALIAARPAAAAPALKESAEGPYFPTRVGARWVTETGGKEYAHVVTAVTRDGKETVVAVGREETVGAGPGKGRRVITPQRTVRVSADGLSLTRDFFGELDSPYLLLRVPAKRGDAWTGRLDQGAFWVRGKRTVAGVEEVEVPAGRFRTVRVEWDRDQPGGPDFRTTIWYAPGVGEVKIALDGKPWTVLKSFAPGGD